MTMQYLVGYNVCEKIYNNSYKCNIDGLYHFHQYLTYEKIHKTFM